MKIKYLSLVVAALSGCGSDSSSDSTPTPSTQVTALFMDSSAVEGVDYKCDSQEQGSTSELGQFFVEENAICDFYLDGYYLGSNREGITGKNNQITAYSLYDTTSVRRRSVLPMTPEQYVANISALLQSIDADANSTNGIDTTKVVGKSLLEATPLDAKNDDEFKAAVANVTLINEDGEENTISPENIKTPSEAKEELNTQYTSENVAEIIDKLTTILSSEDLTTLDIESTINEYRSLLDADDKSNGYHQKALIAILEIAEVLNMPEVADRVTITGGSSLNYTEMLAKTLDLFVTPSAIINLVETPIGTTEDVSRVLAEAAMRLVNASARLGSAMPGEGYVVPYADTGLTYQDSLVIRAGALVAANALYTVASYNAGDDAHYLPERETLSDIDVVTEQYRWNDSGSDITWVEHTLETLNVEYDTFSSDSLEYIQSPEVFTFHSNAVELLTSAKAALKEAVNVAELVTLEDYLDSNEQTDAKVLITQLKSHLNGSKDFISLDGSYADLHAFYSVTTGIDRSDIQIVNSNYKCDMRYYDGNAEYDKELSRIFGEPTCSHNASYIIKDNWGQWTNWDLIKPLHSEHGDNYSNMTFIPAVNAELNVEITESKQSNIIDVAWCGLDENNNKVSCFD